ncbi:MAG: protein-L-isoaspartate O-methyltransferase [Sphingobium sp.]|nr:protein-L-isoaspartate O-methyltransferase [Sphingobium sp.]
MTDQNFTAMRRAMVESQLRTNDVNDPVLLEVILAVPREAFLPEARKASAYIDRSVPLDDGRALNPPLATARLLIEAGINPGDHVLLVGAATGYAAALLARLGCSVVAVEENAALAAQAKTALSDYAGITMVAGSLAKGHAEGAPYDKIVVDGAIETMPDTLIDQLKIGGRAVFASVERGVTRLCSGVRSAGGFGARAFADSEAVVLPGFAAPKGFTF